MGVPSDAVDQGLRVVSEVGTAVALGAAMRTTFSFLTALTLGPVVLVGCEGQLMSREMPGADAGVAASDAPYAPGADAVSLGNDAYLYIEPGRDAALASADAYAASPDAWVAPMPDAYVPPATGLLADDLAITRVDLFQTVRVPLVRDGVSADREGLPVVRGRDALVRIHVEDLAGYSAHEVTAVVEIENDLGVARFTDSRTLELPSTDSNPDSVFGVRVPATAVALGARYRVRLEVAENGVATAPEAVYPASGFDDLDVVETGRPVFVLVPFRYDTDGSGRLPEVGEVQLARIRDELTARFPYADVEIRVHEVVSWSRSNRYTGSVDWGAVNARLISMRDDEGAPESEYWYGLMAPDRTRSSYCARTTSCVTGQAYVATLRGSRVGSGVGFADLDSVATLAHELGHEHGRSHSPCGTSSSDDDYPYSSGRVGVWGWDRRSGAFHDPATASDMMGYCSRQWISDYTYREMYERQMAMRALGWPTVGAAIARRFVTVEDGVVSWGERASLRRLPGERAVGTYLDARGRAIESVEVSRLDFAEGEGHTWVVPDAAPVGAVELVAGDDRIALEAP